MKLNALVFTTVALVIVSLVIGAISYQRLPDRVPTHFDLHGRPDGFTAKPFGVLITPILVAFLGLAFYVLPRISPKGYRLEPFLNTYEIIALAIVAVAFGDGMAALYLSLGYNLDMNCVLDIGLGLLFIILGNFLGKVTRNFFVGIRTPWTLANPEVWLRTHRLGGVLFVAGGAIMVIAGFAWTGSRGTHFLLTAVPLGIALFLTGYSYVIYRQLEQAGSAEE